MDAPRCSFNLCPDAIILVIFNYLNERDLSCTECTCRRLRALFKSHHVWEDLDRRCSSSRVGPAPSGTASRMLRVGMKEALLYSSPSSALQSWLCHQMTTRRLWICRLLSQASHHYRPITPWPYLYSANILYYDIALFLNS